MSLFGKEKGPPPLPPSNSAPTSLVMRELLFGDRDWAQWPGANATAADEEPWATFAKARSLRDAGDKNGAIEGLKRVLAMPELESRHYLQAWHLLRQLGHAVPADQQKRVLGVVIEVGMPEGLDVLAAYPDHHARYYNYSGLGVIWEHPDDSLDAQIDKTLAAGQVVANQIGPWDGPRPPAPQAGQLRLNMLTPSGLFFGQAGIEDLSRDPLGGPFFAEATRLMQALIAKDTRAS